MSRLRELIGESWSDLTLYPDEWVVAVAEDWLRGGVPCSLGELCEQRLLHAMSGVGRPTYARADDPCNPRNNVGTASGSRRIVVTCVFRSV
jgi:hypothetical protein